MIRKVRLTKKAQKALDRCPRHVVVKLLAWVDVVESEGLDAAREIPGYHDEPLRGQRRAISQICRAPGPSAIRLSRAWRALYMIVQPGSTEMEPFVEVTEVTKHDY